MPCFTDTPPANWTYNILLTLSNLGEGQSIVTLGCYAEMNISEQIYQFYKVLNGIAGNEEILSQNCFVQLSEPQQWGELNSSVNNAFATEPEPVEPEPEEPEPEEPEPEEPLEP